MGYKDLALSYSNQKPVVEPPASGGGLSQNGKFSYGYASSAGKRPSMEDFFETRIDGVDGKIVGLFGVFDGHGGARAAEYVKHNLFSNLITHPNFISDTKSAIADAYNHTDSELLKTENSSTRDAGSTASTTILIGDRLLVANVGDSRAVICRSGNAIAVSRDHKPDQSDERERIENAGGFVMWAGTWRVGGVLAVSRAFGDRLLKQYVVADPEIREEKIDDSLEFLILASDGLWDVFSNDEAVAVVKEVEDPEESTKKLVGEAIKRGSADNITCVVVRFLESKTANTKASNISSTHTSSSQAANQGKMAVKKDSDHKVSAKEVHKDLSRNVDNENLNQKPIASRSDDSGRISLSQEANRGKLSVKNDSDHKISAKEVHKDLNRKVDNENLNQKPIAARSDDSGRIISSQEANRGKLLIRNDSDHKISSKDVHKDCSRKVENENLNQKPSATRSDNSSRISSSHYANRGKYLVRNDTDHKISAKEVHKDLSRKVENENLNQKPRAGRSDDSCRITSSQDANRGKLLSRNDSDPKISAKEVHKDLSRKVENENMNQKASAARSDASGRISSSQDASRGKHSVRNDSEHKISTKEVHKHLSREVENENMNQKSNVTRSDDSGRMSSSQDANRGKLPARNDSDHNISTKEVHKDLSRKVENENMNQKPIAARRDDSGHISSSHDANRGKLLVRNDSDPKISAKETNQDHTIVHRDLDRHAEKLTQKLIATRSGDTEHISSSHDANRGKLPIRNDSDHKLPAKETNRDHTTMHNDLDPNAEKLTLKLIAARSGHTERSNSSQDANRGKLHIRNDSDHKISTKETNRDHNTMHNDLDPNAENLTLKLIAARSSDTDRTSSSQYANQGKLPVKNDSDHKISAKETNRDHTTVNNDLDPNAEILTLKVIAARSGDTGRVGSNQKPIANTETKRSIFSKHSGSAGEKNSTSSNKSGSKDDKNKKATAVHRVFNPFSH